MSIFARYFSWSLGEGNVSQFTQRDERAVGQWHLQLLDIIDVTTCRLIQTHYQIKAFLTLEDTVGGPPAKGSRQISIQRVGIDTVKGNLVALVFHIHLW